MDVTYDNSIHEFKRNRTNYQASDDLGYLASYEP